MRRAAKRDEAELSIVEVLETAGWTVTRISSPHLPDLLLSKCGWCGMAEVKTGKKQLRPGQAQWIAEKWQGPPVVILRTIDDALAFNKLHGMTAKPCENTL